MVAHHHVTAQLANICNCIAHVTVLHPTTSSDMFCRLLRIPRVRAKHYHTLMLALVSVNCSSSASNIDGMHVLTHACLQTSLL